MRRLASKKNTENISKVFQSISVWIILSCGDGADCSVRVGYTVIKMKKVYR